MTTQDTNYVRRFILNRINYNSKNTTNPDVKKALKDVASAISQFRLVSDRVSFLQNKGYTVENVPVGTGGTGKVCDLKSETRIQIGYAVGGGYNNYAEAIIIKK